MKLTLEELTKAAEACRIRRVMQRAQSLCERVTELPPCLRARNDTIGVQVDCIY